MKMNRALVEGLLLPWVDSLTQHQPAVAVQVRANLLKSPSNFHYQTLGLHAAWMSAHALPDVAWVYALGETHHDHFRTLAIGKRHRDGDVPITFGIISEHDAHPAPWHWDFIRLLSSVLLTLPQLSEEKFLKIGQSVLSDYERVMSAIARDDDQVERMDYLGLPEALKKIIEADAESTVIRAFYTQSVRGKHLRLKSHIVSDTTARTQLLPRISDMLPKHMTAIDIAGCTFTDDCSSLGQKRWLVLISEVDRSTQTHLRLGQLVETRPSRLSGTIGTNPFTVLHSDPQLKQTVFDDPIQRTIPIPSGSLALSTFCHTRKTIDLSKLDTGDFIRLARQWGQIIATHHVRGLRQCGLAVANLAHQLAHESHHYSSTVISLAHDQARWYRKAYKQFLNKP